MVNFKKSVNIKLAQLEETLDTFSFAENHLRVLKDVNRFNRKMETKVNLA